MSNTTVLRVQLGAVTAGQVARFMIRFGRWFDTMARTIEYPVTCDSHGEDVFVDEFGEVDVSYAAIIELPYPVEYFVPFADHNDATVLEELAG